MKPMLKRYTNCGFHELFRFRQEISNLFFNVEVSNENACHKKSHMVTVVFLIWITKR
jgi:hypothetical protein